MPPISPSAVELLAPAGSMSTLTTALKAGADAVYIGIGDFNMRATAARNFSLEDLPTVVKLCHESKTKLYIALNTLLYNEDMAQMRLIVDAAKKYNVDALIVADMATILYARERGVDVHISTQLAVSNTQVVKHYAQYSDRVVLARELTLEQIRQISDDIVAQDIRGPKGELVELEAFAHGALCVAVSGRCDMSLYTTGASANRGRCTQVCRRKYKVTDEETGAELTIDNNYVMSSADLCTIGMLPELLDAGISVLKFEGRGRTAEYVDTVIRTYREALQAIPSGQYTQDNIDKWNTQLGTVFNRGFSKGMYHGVDFVQWAKSAGNQATVKKVFVGTVQNYFPKADTVQVLIQSDALTTGANYLITGPTTGILKGVVPSMLVNDVQAMLAKQGDVVTFKVAEKARAKDKLYILETII